MSLPLLTTLAAPPAGNDTPRASWASSAAGKLLGGYAAERLPKRLVFVVQFALMSLAAGILFALENLLALYLFVLLYGIGNGGAVVYPLVVAETLGVESFSKILGIMDIPLTLGAALGEMGAARIFDATDSYFGVFIGLMLVDGICVVLVSPAKPPRGAAMKGRHGVEDAGIDTRAR